LIAYERLHKLSGFGSHDQFTDAHRKWVASFLEDGDCVREGKWTQSIAIGTQGFVENTKQKLASEQRVERSLRPGRHTSFESHRFLIRPILASKTTILGLKTPISGMFINRYHMVFRLVKRKYL
jgi:hypothetical protein